MVTASFDTGIKCGHTRILQVPYFIQPDPTWCQSTVLKMMATYIEREVLMASCGGAAEEIKDIWTDINTGTARPQRVRNSLANMKWWLQRHYPTLRFSYTETSHEDAALKLIIQFIDGGFPVLTSVSHTSTQGHIILVIGYENYLPMMSSEGFHLVIHDPYGRFDPTLKHRMFGKHRFDGAQSLMSGGEAGPGAFDRIPVTSASRRRAGDASHGTYRFISCAR